MESTELSSQEIASLQKLKEAYIALKNEIKKIIVGQEEVVDQVLITVFARGHCIIEGVPGLAKTLLINTLAQSLSLAFARIQFTPDLMPADVTGTEIIYEDKATGSRGYKFLPGPIFGNVILADEINRTPPKTQAALLEAMQEYQVTAGGKKHTLPQPFFVLATQNPIEQEGTYSLPEAQLDRFMFNILIGYPSEEEERKIMQMTTTDFQAQVSKILSAEEIISLQHIVRKVPISDYALDYAIKFARLSRPTEPQAPDFVKELVSWGAGPRAGQYLIIGAKAWAALHGEYHATTQDVKAVLHPVLRHRIIVKQAFKAQGDTSDKIIDKLMDYIPTSESEGLADSRLAKALK